MSWTTPPTFVSGDPLAASDLNILGDDLTYLKAIGDGLTLSGCRVRRAASQSIADSTFVAASFDTETLDLGGWYTSGTDVVVPAGAIPAGFTTIGLLIFGACKFVTNSSGRRWLRVLQNGAVIEGWNITANNADTSDLTLSTFTTAVATDVITLEVKQTSGGSLSMSEARLTVLRYGIAS
jgi:hypothetical protein